MEIEDLGNFKGFPEQPDGALISIYTPPLAVYTIFRLSKKSMRAWGQGMHRDRSRVTNIRGAVNIPPAIVTAMVHSSLACAPLPAISLIALEISQVLASFS
jgi:hypothetical protein